MQPQDSLPLPRTDRVGPSQLPQVLLQIAAQVCQMLPAMCDNHPVASISDDTQPAQRLYFLELWRVAAGNQARSCDFMQGIFLTCASGPTLPSTSGSLSRYLVLSASFKHPHATTYKSAPATEVWPSCGVLITSAEILSQIRLKSWVWALGCGQVFGRWWGHHSIHCRVSETVIDR